MTDREIFKANLNYYLETSGMKQKDLADFVGAKTTTVSGWTRGISYPRADAMEKIALFFGVPTSQLVGPRQAASSDQVSDDIRAQTPAIRIVSTAMSMMPDEEQERVLSVIQAMYASKPEYFKKGKCQ